MLRTLGWLINFTVGTKAIDSPVRTYSIFRRALFHEIVPPLPTSFTFQFGAGSWDNAARKKNRTHTASQHLLIRKEKDGVNNLFPSNA